jgi:putative alpha-1,2-mannosidase
MLNKTILILASATLIGLLAASAHAAPEGICGNDDCSQISAWSVWSAIGLYPLNPSSGGYVIGSPLVEKATIKLDSKFYKGSAFTIIAHNVSNQNCCIQSAKLNGKPLNRP